ncbi:MAG TPA: YicC/YloC family endoribonuclease [Thermoanaerobaculia bacterium]|nr:YicC/YloC family endoribonuclease [Thermoanaerobaculia bacterium]
MNRNAGGRAAATGGVIASMTGFGTVSGENGRYRVTVELRSVNHRGLDLVLRLKEVCRASEPELRAMLKERLHRGRVEMAVNAEPVSAPEQTAEIDRGLAAALGRLAAELRSQGLAEGPLGPGDLLRVPGLVRVAGAEASWSEEDQALLRRVAGGAIDRLLETRRIEGASIEDELRRGLQRVRELVAGLAERRDDVTRHYQRLLEERLRSLLGDALPDRQRIEQEIALLVDKSDVNEELERLRAHLDHGEGVFAGPPPAGRRLDVLLQEMLREISTIGAKCRDLEMSRTVIEARLVCEQLREQVQNVE